MKKILFLFQISLLGLLPSSAQTNPNNFQIMKEFLEKTVENQSQVLDQTDLELTIEDWRRHPLYLNKAELNDLNKFFFLSSKQKESILSHIENYGPFLSKYELQTLEEFDTEMAAFLSQFIVVQEKKLSDYDSPFELAKKGTSELILQQNRTLQENKAFLNKNIYAGSPNHLSIRYRLTYSNKLYVGFSLEKDAGEKWGTLGDFQSFHIVYKPKGLIQTIALGDFQANFGKGLNLGTSLFNGKSSLVFQSQYFGENIKPYRSLNESGYLKGIGMSLKHKNIGLEIALSSLAVTASIEYDSLLKEDLIGSIAISGLHRTESEISHKKQARQNVFGSYLHFHMKHFQWGIGYVKTDKIPTTEYWKELKYSLNPSRNYRLSLDGTLTLKNTIWSGEICTNDLGSSATIINGLIPIHPKLDLMFLYRNYGDNFKNTESNAWSAQSAIGNEKGVYFALVFRPNKNRQWSIYSDLFKSNLSRYQAAMASKGSDYFIDYLAIFSKTFQINLRFRKQIDEKNIPVYLSDVKQLEMENKTQARFQLTYQISDHWNYQFRVEKIFSNKPDGAHYEGNMQYHQISFQPKGKKWKLNTRICVFQVEDYSARIFVHEGDVLYNYAQSQLNGNGIRLYFIGQYQLNKHSDFHFKIGHTYLPEQSSIGSGWEEIEGNKKTEIKCQIRMRF